MKSPEKSPDLNSLADTVSRITPAQWLALSVFILACAVLVWVWKS